jgi:hypothetical protein
MRVSIKNALSNQLAIHKRKIKQPERVLLAFSKQDKLKVLGSLFTFL